MDPSDPIFDKKPTVTVCRGSDIVYEYRDRASLVKVAVPLNGYTVDIILERYKTTRKVWKESDIAKERMKTFRTALGFLEPIEEIVCTGLGSLSTQFEDDPHCHSHYWLAEMEECIEVARSKYHKKMKVFIQDASLNHLDEEVLHRLGYNVIHHPDAFSMMTPTTFLQYHDQSIKDQRPFVTAIMTNYVKVDLDRPAANTLGRPYWSLACAVYFRKERRTGDKALAEGAFVRTSMNNKI
ncbi:hypothetical protein MMC26_007541 [Xylographa opegraphella]|nr:hypothetical protein [Xylographa opegraphella]